MNNKILSVVLVAGIATTGFAALSSADDNGTILGGNSEIRELIEKSRNGETLTADEQATLDEVKASKKGHGGFGKRKGLKHLTDEEKAALEDMTDEEKKVFFDEKKEEMKAKKEAHKIIIDKLIAGETLTAEEEVMRGDMVEKMINNDRVHSKPGADIIAKIINGDTLTVDEQLELEQMQEKRTEREAQRAIIEPILDKKRAGADLTDEEQAILDEHKEERKGHGGKEGRKGGNKGERR